MKKFMVMFSGLIFVCNVWAGEIIVNADGSGDFVTIQAGIDAAVDGDTVVVEDGLYSGSGNYNIDFANGLPEGTTRAIIVKSANGPTNCIIDCGEAGGGFNFHSGEDLNSVLDGFTIINGHYSVSALIVCNDSSPDIRNCILEDSWCRGVDCMDSLAVFTDFVINNCSGGGMHLENSPVTIMQCRITNCYAFGYPAQGGGIYCINSDVMIGHSEISHNSVYGSDGQPQCSGELDNPWDPLVCMPEDGGDAYGGGIYCQDSTMILTNCLIAKNDAFGGMGSMPSPCGEPEGQPGVGYGGGIYCLNGPDDTIVISNCTLANNHAYGEWGGAMKGSAVYNSGTGSVAITGSIVDSTEHESFNGSGITTACTLVDGDIFDYPFGVIDPLFVSGPLGDYYLSNYAAGQDATSLCIDLGCGALAEDVGLSEGFTTSTDNYPDLGAVDLGYHYPISEEPSITIINPNGNETFISGTTHEIQWEFTGPVRSVDYQYSTDNGETWKNIASANWTIPVVDSNQCLVRITENVLPDVSDTSDSAFTIFECQLRGDVTGDCYVDIEDFAVMAADWLECGNPFDTTW